MKELLLVLLGIAVLGFIAYLINKYIPMKPIFKQVINVVLVIAIISWLLYKYLPVGIF